MATKHCFTPVTITPPADVTQAYTITYLPPAAPDAVPPAVPADVPNVPEKTFVEYSVTPGGGAGGAGTKDIKFFKFAAGNSAPKYIAKHDDDYAVAVGDVVIIPANTYLVKRKDNDDMLGGSKSSRKGRKSARKGRKSARKSRRSRGSRSKK